jgi:2-polyprenyl-3-methyl-5-hydroxy-6-metoxy-1,4-benzoquinol methylase
MKFSDREWEKLGNKEPYYSIMCDDKYRKELLTGDLINWVFKSGEDFVKYILERIRISVDPTYIRPKNVLDFGCGVGRCSIPLAKISERVVGADISESMLKEARKNSIEKSAANVDYVLSDDLLSRISGTFDLIISFEVFHNIPLERGYKIFEKLIDHLSPNGIIAVDILYYRDEAATARFIGKLRKSLPLVNNLANIALRKPIFEPLIEKNVYNINKLLHAFDKKDCSNIHVEFYHKNHNFHAFLFAQRKTNGTSISDFL